MARESTITFEQVAAVADNIKAQGGKATMRNVRESLGSGSMATILKFLQQWQGGQLRQSQAIDDTMDPSIARAISNQIASKVQEATANATAQLADLQIETDTLIAENERQAADIDLQATELSALQEQHAALAGRTQQLETEATRTAAALVAVRQAAESARVELAKAELRLEAVPRIEAEIEKVRAELLEARAQSAKLHEEAAVATAKLESEFNLRQSISTQLTEATANAAEAVNRAIANAEALSREKVSVQAHQARLEDAARELATANETVNTVRAEAKKAGEEAAELRGQLIGVSKTPKGVTPKK
jgi:chromosome segregation ATPase